MTLEILPEKLFTMQNVTPLLQQKNAGIFHKILHKDLLDKEIYLSQTTLLFIVSGRQIIKQYENQQTQVKQGDMLLLPKDIYLASDYTTHGTKFEALLFFITDEIIDKIRPASSAENGPKIGLAKIYTPNLHVANYVKAFINVYAQQPIKPTSQTAQLLELKLTELLTLMAQSADAHPFINAFYQSAHGRKRDIKQFMRHNHLKNLKVEDYATLTGRSKSTFTREFKQLYGTTPHQWLIEQRLIKANQLLTQNHLNVTQTALAVGYDNVSHFAQAYKNKYGHNPSQTKTTS